MLSRSVRRIAQTGRIILDSTFTSMLQRGVSRLVLVAESFQPAAQLKLCLCQATHLLAQFFLQLFMMQMEKLSNRKLRRRNGKKPKCKQWQRWIHPLNKINGKCHQHSRFWLDPHQQLRPLWLLRHQLVLALWTRKELDMSVLDELYNHFFLRTSSSCNGLQTFGR